MSGSGAEARLRRIRGGMHPYPRCKYPLQVLGSVVKGLWAQEVIEQSGLDMSVRTGKAFGGPLDREGPEVDICALCEDVDSNWAGFLGGLGEDGGAQDIEWASF